MTREVRALAPEGGAIDLSGIAARHDAELPYGLEEGMKAEIVLRCPVDAIFALSDDLVRAGARAVTVRRVDYAFAADNPLAERLLARLGPPSDPEPPSM